METLMSTLIVISSLLLPAGTSVTVPTQSYQHSLVLEPPDIYVLYWTPSKEEITFEIHARTTGYVGFGISPTGGMVGADIMIAWVKGGTAYIQDRYSREESEPKLDASQDWHLLRGYEEEEFTIIQFKRALDTCDDKDVIIQTGTVRLIWSYHAEDPSHNLAYHGEHRGSRSVQLLASYPKPPDLPSDAFNVDFTNPQVRVPDVDTTYWCQYFETPKLNGKHHVIRFEPIIEPAEHKNLVHHILLYGCYGNTGEFLHNFGTMCYQDQSQYVYELSACSTVLFSWAIGGGAYRFPEHVGYPIGGNNYPKFVRMETHYDNPKRDATFVDSSGLRLWLSPSLRQFDAGILETGVMVSRNHVIPPGSPSFTSAGFCLSNCLTEAMGGMSRVSVFASFPHTHLAGRAVRVRHIRQGYELPPLSRDEQYDFQFQETRTLPEERILQPDDDIIVECQYSTVDRDKATYGGLSTKDEMCLVYLWYYPQMNLSNCQSIPLPQQSLKVIEAKTIVRQWGPGSFDWETFVVEPTIFGGLTLAQVAERLKWNDAEREKFQRLVTSGRVISRCERGDMKYEANHQILPVADVIQPLPGPKFKSCAPSYSDMGSSSSPLSLHSISVVLATILFFHHLWIR